MGFHVKLRRRLARMVAATTGALAMLTTTPAAAGPLDGEARSLMRDVDRVYEVVAGEADGGSTVTNPANLGFLEGVNGVIDTSWTVRSARRRGSGVGAFVGFPIRARLFGLGDRRPLFSLGLGYQFLNPLVPNDGASEDDAPRQWDDPYSKVTLAASVPLSRWARGLSFGINYSRLVSSTNFHADGVNQFDFGAAYWPIRFVALGLVARTFNIPKTGPNKDVRQSFVLDPEIAVRPLGSPVLEVAGGLRWAPRVPPEVRFRTPFVEPRGRVFVRAGPVRVFATAEYYRFYPPPGDQNPVGGVKLTGGIEVNGPNFGMAAGVLTQAGGRSNFSADGGAARIRISQERYEGLVVAPRRVTKLALASYGGDRGMWDVIQEIERQGLRGGDLLIETKGMSYGWAQTEEVREAIIRARLRGAKVFVYLEGGTLRHYFLATAADKVLSHPNRQLSILGMRVQTYFFADLLAKLGAKAEFVRIAEYKSTPEKYELSGFTEPSARQRELLYGDIWNHVVRTVSRERGQDVRVIKRWIDTAPYEPSRAVRDGIVDRLAFPDELDGELEGILGHKVRIEKPPRVLHHNHDYGPLPRVAVVVIEGDLVEGESFTIPLLNRKVAGSYTLTKTIEKLRQDNSIVAIVVRINSPGGSVAAADAIARELDLARKAGKPVVISMGNTCASGGYYIATAGDYILSDATTVTGSIGIFYPKVDISGTLELLGIGVDALDLGRRAGMRSWVKPYSPEERQAAQQSIQDSYVVFTRRVADARAMSLARVDDVARGRVWSGARGMEVGLVDTYGGLDDAITKARAIANAGRGPDIVEIYPKQLGTLENLRRLFSFDIPVGRAEAPSGGDFARSTIPKVPLPWPLLRALAKIPVSLWHGDGPELMALAEETIVVED
jgi:protease-4